MIGEIWDSSESKLSIARLVLLNKSCRQLCIAGGLLCSGGCRVGLWLDGTFGHKRRLVLQLHVLQFLLPQFFPLPTQGRGLKQKRIISITYYLGTITCNIIQYLTSRERPKSAPYLRLKIQKGDPSGFVKLQLVAKNEKNWRGTLWGHEKISQKKIS